jgi:translation initiation factor 2 beta subunit (eIF-2beta)/eIF-5
MFGSILGDLVFKLVLQRKQVESVFRIYFIEFVQCRICKRHSTDLVKDMRLWTLQCRECKYKRVVPTLPGAEKKYAEYEKRMEEKERQRSPSQ